MAKEFKIGDRVISDSGISGKVIKVEKFAITVQAKSLGERFDVLLSKQEVKHAKEKM